MVGLVLVAVLAVLAVCGWASICADLWFQDHHDDRWGDDYVDGETAERIRRSVAHLGDDR